MRARRRRRRAGNRLFSQRGVALLVAMVAIAVVTVFTAEFSTNTNVDWAAATNARDDMRNQFLARSAMNLGHLVIKVQTDVMDRYRQYLGDIQLADYVGLFIGAFGGGKDELKAFGEMLGAGGADMKGLGVDLGDAPGGFDVTITTDDNKINLNCANGSDQTKTNLKTKLEALVYFEMFNPLFENPDAEGWRRDRIQQVAALMDYVDSDRTRADQGRGAAEDYGYQTLDDRYKPKNNYLDSVEEIKLIRGVDDKFWGLFGDQFTVYGGCKQNVGALDDARIIAPIIFLAAKNQDDPVLRNPMKLWLLATRVAEAKAWGISFDTLQAFADYVKDPMGAMADLFASSGVDTSATAAQSQFMQVEGIELDMPKLQQIVRAGPRRTYRVVAEAHIGEEEELRINKKITGVYDTQVQAQNARPNQNTKGAWVFWREE